MNYAAIFIKYFKWKDERVKECLTLLELLKFIIIIFKPRITAAALKLLFLS